MTKDFSAEIISLSEAYQLAHQVSHKITYSSETFDIVVGISRGGLPPARIICDFINIKILTSLQIRHYTSGGEEIPKVEVIGPIDIDLKGKNVLIVDDVNDSGRTLRVAQEHVSSFEPRITKIAVLHEKENTSFDAHYIGADLSEWKWVIYPWAVTEDLLEFLDKGDMIQAQDEKAMRYLKEEYELEVDTNLFKKIMSMKSNYLGA